jgi:hypothetical protein
MEPDIQIPARTGLCWISRWFLDSIWEISDEMTLNEKEKIETMYFIFMLACKRTLVLQGAENCL